MPKRILIVEDEVLIAHLHKETLEAHGYQCSGIVISVDKAIAHLKSEKVDLVLIDVNLYGSKSGIDLGRYIDANLEIPFIYLTSYEDPATIKKIKETNPKGYLSKPVKEINLTTLLDLTFSALENEKGLSKYHLKIASSTHKIDLEELLYARTSHVYVELYFTTGDKKVLRTSLTYLVDTLPKNRLLRISRGIAINPYKITKRSTAVISLGTHDFKISKSGLKEIETFFPS